MTRTANCVNHGALPAALLSYHSTSYLRLVAGHRTSASFVGASFPRSGIDCDCAALCDYMVLNKRLEYLVLHPRGLHLLLLAGGKTRGGVSAKVDSVRSVFPLPSGRLGNCALPVWLRVPSVDGAWGASEKRRRTSKVRFAGAFSSNAPAI